MKNTVSQDTFDETGQSLACTERFAGIVRKDLAPEVQRAAAALWAAYESLDLEVITTLRDAEQDLLAAMPDLNGYENEIRQLVAELTIDLRTNFYQLDDQPVRLRFAYQGEKDLIGQLLSASAARLVVMPVENDISLHTNIHGEDK